MQTTLKINVFTSNETHQFSYYANVAPTKNDRIDYKRSRFRVYRVTHIIKESACHTPLLKEVDIVVISDN